jgi:hypothetical protein
MGNSDIEHMHPSAGSSSLLLTTDFVSACMFILSYQSHLLTARRPILTYGRQATTKSGVKSEDHAIIYTGVKPPREIDGEEKLRLHPIQVIPRTPRDKLEKESRINYRKIYTVEHNVKVYFMGHVAPSSQDHLYTDFDTTWMKGRYKESVGREMPAVE